MAQPWLIQSKLQPPRAAVAIPRRADLADPFAHVLAGPVTLVLGPPGYGKTTLLSEWYSRLEKERDVSLAWVSLDDDDRQFNQFAGYLMAALADAGVWHSALDELLDQDVPVAGFTSVKVALSNALNTFGKDLVLFLDDYHRSTAPENDRLLDFLLATPIAGFHMVIASRVRPDLQLAALRVAGALREVTVEDLAFSASEMRAFLPTGADDETLALLESRLEGWPAGLQLARIWMDRSEAPRLTAEALSGRSLDLARYLAEEVFQTLPADLQHFLLCTSILERVNGDIANALTGDGDGWEKLDLVSRQNLFLIPLDSGGEWYRYHTLFAEFLQERLRRADPEKKDMCHRRAAEWFAGEGLYREAFSQARRVQEVEYFPRLVERCGGWRLTLRTGSSVLDVTRELEPSVLYKFPSLGLGYVYTLAQQGQVEEAGDIFASLRHQTGDFHVYHGKDWDSGLYADSRAIEFILRLYRDDIPSVEETLVVDRLIRDLPDVNPIINAILVNLFCFAYFFECRLEEALEAGKRGIANCRALNLTYAENYVYLFNGLVYLALGKVDLAEAEYLKAKDRADESFGEGHSQVALADAFLGELLLEKGAPEAAAMVEQALPLVEARDGWIEAVTVGYVTTASTRFLEAGLDAALEVLDRGRQIARARAFPRLDTHMRALGILFHLRADRTADAVALLNAPLNADIRAGLPSPIGPLWRIAEPVVSAIVLCALAEQDNATAETAEITLRAYAEETGNRHARATADILAALIADAKGDARAARDALARGLSFIRQTGLKRLLLDFGPAVEKLGGQVLAGPHALDAQDQALLTALLTEAGTDQRDGGNGGLSPREAEILKLIADGYSNKEIAGEIGLAEGTVKTYRKRLYQKLEVGSRSQAIARARELDLLD